MRKTRSFILTSAAVVVLIAALALYSAYIGPITPLENAAATVMMPVQRAFSRVTVFVRGVCLCFTGYDELLQENIRLKEQLASSRESVTAAAAVVEENRQLRALSGLEPRSRELTLVTAELVGYSGGLYRLDRGTEDGVAVGQCVITGEGVAGLITRTGQGFSVMTGLDSLSFSASAKNIRTRETSVIRGGERPELDCLLPTSHTKPGDGIVTSGQGGLFPPDLGLGTVAAVYDAADGLSRRAVLSPAVEPKEQRQVFIVTACEVAK